MVSGLEMVNDLNALSDALTQAIHDMAKHGKKYAECEKAYKVRLMQETLKLRDAGMPVILEIPLNSSFSRTNPSIFQRNFCLLCSDLA